MNNTPNTKPKPLPRITPNTRYSDDGHPLTNEDSLALRSGRAIVVDRETDCKAKLLRNGMIAIGDLY